MAADLTHLVKMLQGGRMLIGTARLVIQPRIALEATVHTIVGLVGSLLAQ